MQKKQNPLTNKQENLTIEEAAKIANVTTATIRNWIKTNHISPSKKGGIVQASFNAFMQDIVGKKKLTSRANKLLKDKHNHTEITQKIKQLLQQNDTKNIGDTYENLLSNSYRNKEGIYYTPAWIINDMLKNLKINDNFMFLDPCCGSGNFIIEALKLGVSPENIYGFDTDENAVSITKQRIKKEFGLEMPHIKVGDFLTEVNQLKERQIVFDGIFTNPPWGKKFDKTIKKQLAHIFDCGNSLDTTSLFMAASLSILKQNGTLGFLVQEAFFNISNFEYIRKKIIALRILRFVDYGKAFKGLITKAQAIIVKNEKAKNNSQIECCFGNTTYRRSLVSFKNNPKTIFNFWTNKSENQVINKLYAAKYITLKNKAQWAIGIVTGNNRQFCSSVQKEGYIPAFKGSDIRKKGLKNPSIFISANFENFQQVAPLPMYQAKEKLIYKFISSDLCFYNDTQQRYVINSANILIPDNLGISNYQLAMLLNSEIINWLFKQLFSTHKILRSDLEILPLHTDYFSHYTEFSEASYLDYLHIEKTKNGSYQVKK